MKLNFGKYCKRNRRNIYETIPLSGSISNFDTDLINALIDDLYRIPHKKLMTHDIIQLFINDLSSFVKMLRAADWKCYYYYINDSDFGLVFGVYCEKLLIWTLQNS